MKCQEVILYLSASADELDPVFESARAAHLETCAVCAAEAAHFTKLRSAIASVSELEVEPPARLVPEILARADIPRRRALPLVPVPVEIVRVLQENKETIAGVAGVALVGAGAAWAVWRSLRSVRRAKPAQA